MIVEYAHVATLHPDLIAQLAGHQKPVLGVMLVEAVDSGSIRVEILKGVGEANGFTSAASVYER